MGLQCRHLFQCCILIPRIVLVKPQHMTFWSFDNIPDKIWDGGNCNSPLPSPLLVPTAPYTQRCTVSKVDFCAPPPNKSARKMTSFRNYPQNHISYGMESGLNNVNIPFFSWGYVGKLKKVMWSFVYFKGNKFSETIIYGVCHISKLLNEICVHQFFPNCVIKDGMYYVLFSSIIRQTPRYLFGIYCH